MSADIFGDRPPFRVRDPRVDPSVGDRLDFCGRSVRVTCTRTIMADLDRSTVVAEIFKGVAGSERRTFDLPHWRFVMKNATVVFVDGYHP